MVDRGWVALHRSLLDHWLWDDKPFSQGQAWVDLIMLANHKEAKSFVDGNLKTFAKGTVNRSIESLSTRWGWNRKKTRKFLNALQNDQMVIVKSTTHGTTITIVNYSLFQDIRSTIGKTIDQTKGKRPTQPRDINNNDITMNNNESEEPELAPVKISRYKTGKYENVYLSSEEAAKLMKEYGEVLVSSTIESLSEYMKTHKTNYQDDGHYALICKWIREDKKKNPGKEEEEYNARQREAIRKSCEIGIG